MSGFLAGLPTGLGISGVAAFNPYLALFLLSGGIVLLAVGLLAAPATEKDGGGE